MRRISTATRVVNKFGVGKDGFTNGNPVGGIAATDLEDAWFDHVQEEVATFVEAAGLTLDPNNRSQMLAALPKLATGRYLGTRVFTTSQTYTPSAGTTRVIVEIVGGGGGGGNTTNTNGTQVSVTGGGGAGGYARSYLTSGFSGVSITIGSGGAANTGGGTSSFGGLLSATGGAAGPNGPAVVPGATALGGTGGVGSSGNLLNAKGNDGGIGVAGALTSFVSGYGGASAIGAGGAGQPTTTGGGVGAISSGSGGGGALAGTSVGVQVGGAGASGLCLVHEFA